jgi:hypothetical protein
MFAGVDWGGARHQLAVVDDTGSVVLNQGFAHDRDGLDAMLEALGAVHVGVKVPVAIERSEGILGEALQANGHAVFPVSPRVAARARE